MILAGDIARARANQPSANTEEAARVREEAAKRREAQLAAIDLKKVKIPVLAVNGDYDRPFAKTHRMWRELDNFSSGSVCLVLASNRYDEDDYYRDYDEYRRALETMK